MTLPYPFTQERVLAMGPEKGLLIPPHAMETKETDLVSFAESMYTFSFTLISKFS